MRKMIQSVMTAMLILFVMGFAAQAGTTTNWTGAATMPASGLGKVFVLENSVNFATYNMADDDRIQMFGIPAGCAVIAVEYQITTASTLSGTWDVGDGDTDTQFLSNIAAQTAATNMSAATTWQLYGTAGTIDLVSDSTLTNGVVVLRALIVKFDVMP